MLEVRWHGRGGQGAKTAAQFLAEAALDLGKYIQAFPEYGPERAGAPIRAFTRIDEKPINIHSPITDPEIVVVIDPTLLESIDVTEGIGDKGILLVNTPESPETMRDKLNFRKGVVATVDATGIALEEIGRPITNTVLIGALLHTTGWAELDTILEVFKNSFSERLLKSNIRCAQRGFEETIVKRFGGD